MPPSQPPASPPLPPPSPPPPGDGQGLYVFGLVRTGLAPDVAALGGFGDGEPLVAVPLRGLWAVACRVPLSDWSAATGAARRADLAWLGPRAIRHQEILEQLMAAGAVLPLRFGRVFASAEHLGAAIDRERAAVSSFLDEAAGQEEWVLTGVLSGVLGLAAPSGAAAARARAHQEAAGIAQLLDGLWRRRRVLPVAPPTGGDGAEVVLRWALLLSHARLGELMHRLEELEAPLLSLGLSLEARGPWPPYSFAPPLDDSAADSDEG